MWRKCDFTSFRHRPSLNPVPGSGKIPQVSSMKSTTKLTRILIHHWRSTVILCRWILIDRRYWPYSLVGESLLTVDIDRDWSTGSINRWIGIDIQIDVGTISHHSWDHESFVDVYPGPFLITSGTIWDHTSWSFFSWLLGKMQPGPKAKRLKRHTRKRNWAVGTQKAGWCRAPGSLHTKSLETVDVALLSSSSSVPRQRTFSAHSFRSTLRPVSSRVSALVQVYIYV